MQHLQPESSFRKPVIYHVTNQQINPPNNFRAFHDFPKVKGWRVNPTDHRIHRIQSDKDDSHEHFGQRLSSFGGEAEVEDSNEVSKPNLRSFIQAWLLFGLVFTVIQTNNKPLLSYEELVDGDFVTTTLLPDRLEMWKLWEKSNPSGRRLRMLRVEHVLDVARKVVRANLAGDAEPLGYSENPQDECYVSDEMIISIMTVGETISSVKNKILEGTGSNMRGWSSNESSDWGPPRYVLRRLKWDGWCPRTISYLQSQLRSNATHLLAALNILSRSIHAGLRHRDCTKDVCYVFQKDASDRNQQNHCPAFCENDSEFWCRDFLGPNIEHIKDLLENKRRPLLKFIKTKNESDGLEVIEWTQTEPPMVYVTISHVWSDGFGNPDRNALRLCQLKFIKDQLKRLQQEQHIKESLPFWMDALIIPVGTSPLKREAIRQIHDTFRDSTYTIVLDSSLSMLPVGPAIQPAATTTKILASSWMRRLWTLQETYLRKSAHIEISSQSSSSKQLENLFGELTEEKGGLTTARVQTVNQQLQHNASSYEMLWRLERAKSQGFGALNPQNPVLKPREAAAQIADAWRAVRWRVSCMCDRQHLSDSAIKTLANYFPHTRRLPTNATKPSPSQHCLNLKLMVRAALRTQGQVLGQRTRRGSDSDGARIRNLGGETS